MKIVLTSVRLVVALALTSTAVGAVQAQNETYLASTGDARVTVEQGDLRGFVQDGIVTFRGIPYAQAERFEAPQPPTSWEGTRLAINYGEICHFPTLATVPGDDQFNPHRYFPESEDCQFLNVWTPAADAGKRPVIVWIHGGAFTNGSSVELVAYDGANLSRLGDAVVVSVNHRLNVLGMADMSQFGDQYVANPGMRDLVAALEWINANIAAFGGDPANVTIMGQSGGGGKVNVLMGAPDAQDLFDKSIIQSGSTTPMSDDIATEVATKIVANLGLTADTFGEIVDVDYDTLYAAGQKALTEVKEVRGLASLSWQPSVDGEFLPQLPLEGGWDKYAADKPLLIGNVMHEFNTVVRVPSHQLLDDNWNDWSAEHTSEKLSERFAEKAEAVADAWSATYPERLVSEAFYFADDWRQRTLDWATYKAEHGSAPVYNYLYTWNSPVLDGIAGAWHVADVPMALYNVDLTPQSYGGGDAARALSFRMASAVANFARTGNPESSGLPAWPEFTSDKPATMIFDNTSIVRVGHDADLLAAMKVD